MFYFIDTFKDDLIVLEEINFNITPAGYVYIGCYSRNAFDIIHKECINEYFGRAKSKYILEFLTNNHVEFLL